MILPACGQKTSDETDPATAALGLAAKELSLSWLERALDEASLQDSDSSEIRSAILDVHEILRTRGVLSAPGAWAHTCDSNEGRFTAAFVTNDDKYPDIYVCAASKNFGKIFLAQVLIHEALHLRGETDECATTRLEILIMTRALRIPYKNSYVDACGLDSLANH